MVCGALKVTECTLGEVKYGIILSKRMPVEFRGSEPHYGLVEAPG